MDKIHKKKSRKFRCTYKTDGITCCDVNCENVHRCKDHPQKTKQSAADSDCSYGHSSLIVRQSGLSDVYIGRKRRMISAGNGLWTTCESFQFGDYITEYSGLKVTMEELINVDDNIKCGYTLQCPKSWDFPFIIGHHQPVLGEGQGSFINRGDVKSTNCKLSYDSLTQKVWVRATRFIPPNSEFFMRYGNGYKLKH